MQNFAINGGLLNGDPEVWADSATANVVVQTAADGMRGLVLEGEAQVKVASSLSLAYMAKLSGAAGVTLQADGAIVYGVSLVGASQVKALASGSGLRWAMLSGLAPARLQASGDIGVSASISATFTMIFSGDMDLKVSTSQQIEGIAPVVIRSRFDAYSVPATPLLGLAKIQAAGIGSASLKVSLPAGSAQIRFGGDGYTRLGFRHSLEGDATLQMFARAELESWHYVYAEGWAEIAIAAQGERYGIPIIPGIYVEAPVMRALRVSAEARRFNVPAERRV